MLLFCLSLRAPSPFEQLRVSPLDRDTNANALSLSREREKRVESSPRLREERETAFPHASATVVNDESSRGRESCSRESCRRSLVEKNGEFSHLEPRLLQRHEPPRRLLLGLVDLQDASVWLGEGEREKTRVIEGGRGSELRARRRKAFARRPTTPEADEFVFLPSLSSV